MTGTCFDFPFFPFNAFMTFIFREYAYEMRVKILDALDYDANYDNIVEGEKETNDKIKMKVRSKFGLCRYGNALSF
jgi:hypothetical protein